MSKTNKKKVYFNYMRVKDISFDYYVFDSLFVKEGVNNNE